MTALGKRKVCNALGLQPFGKVWTSSLRRTESGGMTFQSIKLTTKSGRNR